MSRAKLVGGPQRIHVMHDVQRLNLALGYNRESLERVAERTGLAVGSPRLDLPGGDISVVGQAGPDYVSMTFRAEATTGMAAVITTTAVLSGAQYPNENYGVIRFRFTSSAGTITANWGRVDIFANHQTITYVTGAKFQGKWYTVEYSIKVNGVVTIDWTTIAGKVFRIPEWPEWPWEG